MLTAILQYEKYFGENGLAAVQSQGWSQVIIADDSSKSEDVQVG